MKPIAQKNKNTLEFILQRDIWVFADRFQLKRVIKNLIQNAISYGKPKTPIEINNHLSNSLFLFTLPPLS